jgi:hypothetical protein
MNRKARVMETWDQRTPDAPPFKVPNVKAVEICGFERGLNDRHHSYSLFVQFPYGIKDKLEAKLLHPGIEAVKLSPETKRYNF